MNRGLIREYLSRTRAPPAIFRPTTPFTVFNPISAHQQLVNIAYKHPQLLVDDNDNDRTDVAGASTIVEPDSISCDPDKSNQSPGPHLARPAAVNPSQDDECRLIGKVNPNLVKTWNQLNQSVANYPFEFGHEPGATDESFTIRRGADETIFYDSIDNNQSIITEEEEEELIASICEQMAAGGEAMAEYLSYIKKRETICWSIDSVN